MKQNFHILITAGILALFAGCTTIYLKNWPKEAVAKSINFSKLAFVNQNYSEAYQFIRKDIALDFTIEKFKEKIITMHPSGEFPKEIVPLEYEVIVPRKQVNVYLYGESPKEKHYYKIIMIGTVKEGYMVSEMDSRSDPFPPTELTRFKLEKA